MNKCDIFVVDQTLREGEQTPGLCFTPTEKVKILKALDTVGIPFADVGMVGISEDEIQAIKAMSKLKLSHLQIGVSVRLCEDEIIQAIDFGIPIIFLMVPVSPLFIQRKLRTTYNDLKEKAQKLIHFAKDNRLKVFVAAEDASRSETRDLVDWFKEFMAAGADIIFFSDTVGLMTPEKIKHTVKTIKEAVKEIKLGVHCHNDFGLATANTIAAMEAGVKYPTVTVNGLGERAGIANLAEVVVIADKLLQRKTGINLRLLQNLSELVENISGIPIQPHAPIVGLNAFRHESGIHVNGLLKDERLYTPISPEELGRKHEFVFGKHSGRSSLGNLLASHGRRVNRDDLGDLLIQVKSQAIKKDKQSLRNLVRTLKDMIQNMGVEKADILRLTRRQGNER